MKASRLLILAAAAVVMAGAPALAFHDGGVAHCNGCHTMHNSQNGIGMNYGSAPGALPGSGTAPGVGYSDLLLFADKTDVCLRCHDGGGSYHVWSADPLTPNAGTANRGGGDFVFLEEDNINDAHAGASNPILGHAAGHSVISTMKSTAADPSNCCSDKWPRMELKSPSAPLITGIDPSSPSSATTLSASCLCSSRSPPL